MKPFSLDTVLDFRIQLEKLALNRLYAAEKERSEALLQLQRHEAAFMAMVQDLARLQANGMDIGEMIRYDEMIDVLNATLHRLRIVLTEKEESVKREREFAVQKSKERKVMEKLKEKQNAAWQRHLNKKEAAVLDEIAVIFHER
ncbi:MAG: flagellar export protein FliJ [Desulfocapsaceae bacterium]|nr:flagellar export protein FliJ [Desulfocapsaceae bacterium]